jgi:hypothetical protein
MDSEETNRMIRQLAYEWVNVELPTQRLTYTDYICTITGLNYITDNPDRTIEIVSAIIQQAKLLGYFSEWVQAEIKFEAQAEATGDRANWLQVEVAAQDGSDYSLDLYNERLTRFLS